MLTIDLVQTDSYDREAFARVIKSVPDINELIGRGSRLLPHFEALLQDLFAALFKLAVRLREPSEVAGSTALNRKILSAAMGSPQFFELKDETALDAARAAHAACELARRALALVRSGDLLLDEELLAGKQLAEEEERLAQARAAAEDLGEDSGELGQALEQNLRDAEGQVKKLGEQLKQSLSEMPPRFDAELSQLASRLSEDIARRDDAAQSFARSLGAAGPRSAGERLRLAEKLETSEKLRKLARLAGAFRADARAARRKRRERAATEVFRIGRGADVGRLLPSELFALRQPLRRRDFLRRFIEEELAQYDLRGDDRHGRGPVVICIDGSGSMSGERELWAKAVALALLDIARKQGRRARALVFAGEEAEVRTFDLTSRGKLHGRKPVDLDEVIRLAECFPGGGTDFQKPLRLALEAVRESELKGADIVFITDGEATIPEAFAGDFVREKKRRDLSLYAVLVDDPSRNAPADRSYVQRAAKELGKVADEMTTVTELTAEAVRGVFKAI